MDAASLCARCRSFQIHYSKRLHLQFLLYDTFFKNANVFFLKSRKNNSILQKTWELLHIPHRLALLATSPASRGSEYTGLPRYHGERSTSANHTSLSLVFLGRFPIRPVTQSASSCGLASWTGQQGGPRKRWKGHKIGAAAYSCNSPAVYVMLCIIRPPLRGRSQSCR